MKRSPLFIYKRAQKLLLLFPFAYACTCVKSQLKIFESFAVLSEQLHNFVGYLRRPNWHNLKFIEVNWIIIGVKGKVWFIGQAFIWCRIFQFSDSFVYSYEIAKRKLLKYACIKISLFRQMIRRNLYLILSHSLTFHVDTSVPF